MPTNNLAQSIIDQYLSADQARQKARADGLARIEKETIARFSDNCRIWLGDLWDEFQPGDVSFEWTKEQDAFMLFLPISWQGVNGAIQGGSYQVQSSRHYYGNTPAPKLSFEIVRFQGDSYGKWGKSIELPHEWLQEDAVYRCFAKSAPDSLIIGELLASALFARQAHEAGLEAKRQEERKHDIGMYENWICTSWEEDQISHNLELALNALPDLIGRWQSLADQQRQCIEKRERDRIQDEAKEAARKQARQAERDRLEAIALARFSPFVVYRVTYGARTEGGPEDEDYYTDNCYTLASAPDPDGWWTVVSHGKASRARLPNVIRVDEIAINTPEDARSFNVCETEYLYSEDKEVFTTAYWLPAELCSRSNNDLPF